MAGATQPLDDDAGAFAGGAAPGDPAGATQLLGAEAVGVAAGGAAADGGGAPVGVDCILASSLGDGLPSAGRPLACSKLAIAPCVLGPI